MEFLGKGTDMWRSAALVILAAVIWPRVSSASERVQVCAKYRVDYGWSESYKVQATKSTGSELNRATGSWDYEGFATYVVIFWGPDQASIIKMDWPHLSAVGTEGEDQRGTKWEVSTSSMCF